MLEGRSLRRRYRSGAVDVPAVDGIDLRIGAGEFLALEGPSGSGKTTLINLLGLLDRPDSGEVLLEGRTAPLDENARAALRLRRFGFVFQSFNLVPVLTARENVALPLVLAGWTRPACEARAAELLAEVGLADRGGLRPDLLSGGERQRVAIARALALVPALLLADEPTASLDSVTADGILDLFSGLNRSRNVTLVVATHDPRVVARARRVLTLRDGRVVGER